MLTPMARVLVVEDEEDIAFPLVRTLEREGYSVGWVEDGRAALDSMHNDRADVVILDLGLPDMDGLEVCRKAREAGFEGAIMIVTARAGELDRVVGLDYGADDYLAKPFGVRELVARVRALLRRPRASQLAAAVAAGQAAAASDRPVHLHGIDIDPARRRVRVRGDEVELTAQEFRLLHLLASHPGIVFSREALLSRVWPDHTFVTLRSVDTLVKRLRRRIEQTPAEPSLILTIWGSGYKFADVS
jgi:DNA-binding response OmpR family regulator